MFFHRQRTEGRLDVAVPARLRIGDRVVDATVTNASSRGVHVLVASPPQRGTAIELEIGGSVLKGQVRWRSSKGCGIVLKERVSLVDLMQGRAVPATSDPDRRATRGPLDIFRRML